LTIAADIHIKPRDNARKSARRCFAAYTANFASYGKTYGALASIVVLLLWLWLSSLALLIGAEVDGADQP
jgi:hypothetical protein